MKNESIEINSLDLIPHFSMPCLKYSNSEKYLKNEELDISEELSQFIDEFNIHSRRVYVLGEKTKSSLCDVLYKIDTAGYVLKGCIEKELNIPVRFGSPYLNDFVLEMPTPEQYVLNKSFFARFRRFLELTLVKDLNPVYWEDFNNRVKIFLGNK